MGAETFLRLPQEKRDRFLDAAWEEFTQTSFEDASINKIIQRAQVPRGSFYQYFTDKKELFFFLIGNMMKRFMEIYCRLLRSFHGDLFATQLRCYDMVLLDKEMDPLFEKGLVILQNNLGFLLRSIADNRVGYQIWEIVKEDVDTTHFRGQDTDLARETFVLSLLALVMSMGDAMANPAQIEQCRRDLLTRLDLLKHGSLVQTNREET